MSTTVPGSGGTAQTSRRVGVLELLVLAGCAGGLLAVIVVVLSQGAVWGDRPLLSDVLVERSPTLTAVALSVTSIASFPFVVLFAAGAAVGVDRWLGTGWSALLRVLVVLGVDVIAVTTVKTLVHRVRPPLPWRLVTESDPSLPSGHVTVTAAVAGVLVLWVVRCARSPRSVAVAFIAAVVLTVAIAWTRLYLGVHWPSDVIAGALFGVALACAVDLTLSRVQAGRLGTRAAPGVGVSDR